MASSPSPRDLVSMTRSVLRLSCVKTQAWLAVQDSTVKPIAIETSRLARHTRRAALRTKLACPDEIEELFQGRERPLK